MSLTTQLVIAGHLSVEEICHRLRTRFAKAAVSARPRRASDHWTIELQNPNGEWQAIDVFLNSYASADYAELGITEGTLLVMGFSPGNHSLLSAFGSGMNGWAKLHEGAAWQLLV